MLDRLDVIYHRRRRVIVLRVPGQRRIDIRPVAHNRITGPVYIRRCYDGALMRMHQPQGVTDLVQHRLEAVAAFAHIVVVRARSHPDIAAGRAGVRQIGPGGRRLAAFRKAQVAGNGRTVCDLGKRDIRDIRPVIERGSCRRFLVLAEFAEPGCRLRIAGLIDGTRRAETERHFDRAAAGAPARRL